MVMSLPEAVEAGLCRSGSAPASQGRDHREQQVQLGVFFTLDCRNTALLSGSMPAAR